MAMVETNDENLKKVLAPDGVPLSTITGMSAHPRGLIHVVLIDDPDYRMLIGPEQFDAKIHKKVDPPKATRPARVRPEFMTESESDLLIMTMAKLKDMPEYGFIEDPATTKTELVKQILEIRAGK